MSSDLRSELAAANEKAMAKTRENPPHLDPIAQPGDAQNPPKVAQAQTVGGTNEHILQFFAFGHLPPHLAAVSEPFAALASDVVMALPRNPERTVALRKLLEAKDAAVRALLAK